MNQDFYDEDYYEHGLETGKSCYQNYRWIPELTISMAMTIVDYLSIKPNHTVLDYGCSKGYLVKALRILRRASYGFDVSEYAIANCDKKVRDYCSTKLEFLPKNFDWCIAKDVFEHIPENKIGSVLKVLPSKSLFVVVPLGKDGHFRAPANNLDLSHVTCQDEEWWAEKFWRNNFDVYEFEFRVPGIKDSYYKKYPKAHGFFTLERRP